MTIPEKKTVIIVEREKLMVERNEILLLGIVHTESVEFSATILLPQAYVEKI